MTKQQQIIENKLKKIISKKTPKNKMFPKKDIEIENAKIKNITQAIASYGAQEGKFIGMLTLTFGRNDYDRVLINDYESTIIKKTKIMYNSVLYYLEQLKKTLSKKGFKLIYIAAFELQKDGNFHSHIYFSLDIKAFGILFNFYHKYNTSIVTEKTVVKFNKITRTIIPVGRTQLGIAREAKTKLEKIGFQFKVYTNPKNPNKVDYRCVNFVSKKELQKGSWPTLFFYGKKELKEKYGEKIVKYLMKNYTKNTRQKAIGSQYIKHNTKMLYEKEEWNDIQKKFIRKVCKRLYVASRLPISISAYQKFRKEIIKAYDRYKNLNTLISDLLSSKAIYKNFTLTCPNGKSIRLK